MKYLQKKVNSSQNVFGTECNMNPLIGSTQNLIAKMHPSWYVLLKEEFQKPYMDKIRKSLKQTKKTNEIYPSLDLVFEALFITPFDQVKVVILGQDPYHEPKQAHGLSFSVPQGVQIPPSLRNIFVELKNDVGILATSGCLEKWAKQGVLLLNSILTVSKGIPASHRNFGWEIFTDKILEVTNLKESPIVYILWGAYARKKKELLNTEKNLIIESSHPSPLSADRGFLGSKPFSRCNAFLASNHIKEIDWSL